MAKSTVRLKTFLAALWSLFTVTLVAWWVYFFLFKSDRMPADLRRMLFMEGSVLLVAVFVGGLALLALSIKDQRRHEKLQFFFSQFSHDLKTAMTRLRLQSEILLEHQERLPASVAEQLLRFTENMNHLDLQLENSLWMSKLDLAKAHLENFNVSTTLSQLRTEFPDIKISLQQDALIFADRRITNSIFRNLLYNAINHGKATELTIRSDLSDKNHALIEVTDNGQGSSNSLHLGQFPTESSQGKGSGLGLFLCRNLMKEQGGSLTFSSIPGKSFSVQLRLKRSLESEPVQKRPGQT